MKKVISILLILSFCVTLFSCQNDANEAENNGDWDYVLPTPVVNADISLPFTSADTFNPYKAKSKLTFLPLCVIIIMLWIFKFIYNFGGIF